MPTHCTHESGFYLADGDEKAVALNKYQLQEQLASPEDVFIAMLKGLSESPKFSMMQFVRMETRSGLYLDLFQAFSSVNAISARYAEM